MTSPTGRVRLPVIIDRVSFALVVALSVVILFVPTAPGVPLFPYADKVIHFSLFAALAWSGRRAGIAERPLAVSLVGYAAASELVQAFLLPRRSGDWTDFVADSAGAVIGLVAARWRRRPG